MYNWLSIGHLQIGRLPHGHQPLHRLTLNRPTGRSHFKSADARTRPSVVLVFYRLHYKTISAPCISKRPPGYCIADSDMCKIIAALASILLAPMMSNTFHIVSIGLLLDCLLCDHRLLYFHMPIPSTDANHYPPWTT